MNLKNKLKQWFINPCNKCLVYSCCIEACTKLKFFVKTQLSIWISIGFIFITFILYKLYLIFNMIALIIFIPSWLISGFLIYRAISSPDKDNIFAVMFSFIWLPYLILSVVMGIFLVLFFMKKRNVEFITGNIWKEKIN